MTQKPSLLFFGEDWGRHNSTGQYLAQCLQSDYRVHWVDSLGLRRPRLNREDMRRVVRKLGQVLRRRSPEPSRAPEGGIDVLTPLVLPWHGAVWADLINRGLLKRLLAAHRIGAPSVLVSACPAAADITAALPADIKVYYCADRYSALPGMDAARVARLERKLMASVDLVVATSRSLWEEKRRVHPHVTYLPHGVDYSLFATAIEPQERPVELQSLDAPLIGFVGLLGEHIDMGLIEALAAALPEATVVLIGPLERGCALPQRANIRYLGPRTHRQLPAYLACFDLAIAPYRDSERLEYANPTKLREYLAAGLNVVSTPVPEAARLSPHVHFHAGHQEFIGTAARLLSRKDAANERRERISRSMSEESWQARARSLKDMIDGKAPPPDAAMAGETAG